MFIFFSFFYKKKNNQIQRTGQKDCKQEPNKLYKHKYSINLCIVECKWVYYINLYNKHNYLSKLINQSKYENFQ